jgi:hypothetical protein
MASRALPPHGHGLERCGECVPEVASDPGVVKRAQLPHHLLDVRLDGGPRGE